MKTFYPGVVMLGATPRLDRFGRFLRTLNPKTGKKEREWNMPKPIRHEPHWINPKLRAEAEAKGLDRMTAGVKYVIMVPIYRGLASNVFAVLKNMHRRKQMKRWSG